MERRFVRAWESLEARVDAGESWQDVMRSTRVDDLVAALAGAGGRDPVAANVLATEILNRVRRGPFLGTGVVSGITAVLIAVLDYVYTGTLFLFEAGARTYILATLALATSGASFIALAMWRGHFARVRARFRKDRDY